MFSMFNYNKNPSKYTESIENFRILILLIKVDKFVCLRNTNYKIQNAEASYDTSAFFYN